MKFKDYWKKIQSKPWLRVLIALVTATLIFYVGSFFVENLFRSNLVSSELSELEVPGKSVQEGGRRGQSYTDVVGYPSYPRRPHYYYTFSALIKPVIYIALFLIIYTLFIKKRANVSFKDKIKNDLFFLALAVILIIFTVSSADLLRVFLDYILKEPSYYNDTYRYERFARKVAKRVSAMLLSFPIFAFLNFKFTRKEPTPKVGLLTLAIITGIFKLALAYALLNGLFLLLLGVSGLNLIDYTFPLAYFFVLFPIFSFYLILYLKKR